MTSLPTSKWGREFKYLVQLLRNTQTGTSTGLARSYRQLTEWDSQFAAVIHDLLDPESPLAAQYTELHQVLSRRYDAALADRDVEISRCDHLFYDETGAGSRSDGILHQTRRLIDPDTGSRSTAEKRKKRWLQRCRIITEDFVIRGILGAGAYGVVFLAHKKGMENELYAIKMQNLVTIFTTMEQHNRPDVVGPCGNNPQVAPLLHEDLPDLSGSQIEITDLTGFYYVPVEAYILLLANECDRFPTLDSVYSHEDSQAIVMSAHVDKEVAAMDWDPDATYDQWESGKEKIRACTAKELIQWKKTYLKEHMVCKIASHLLEAVAYLRDMGISHDDIKHDNYIIDENLNTTLIDIGLYKFALDEFDYTDDVFIYAPVYEGLITPEVTCELLKKVYQQEAKKGAFLKIKLTHDVRMVGLWALASNIYEILHGYFPWEDPEYDDRIESLYFYASAKGAQREMRVKAVDQRRRRVINTEVPLREGLSQDCADAMLMMFAKDPNERPSLPVVESYPWFGQWDYRDPQDFRRPTSVREYEAEYDIS
ncbi:Protein kinase domain-containing protein [Aspergillus saccharolyticus JOP 1030-1]|uniref:Kinase-like protein n=1 Tax=Aspergillus saccharolyticus JOP 1030-1 TaxID=1450539 RepID=A0A318YYW2_9EURO|nr:kinase-like protein [Aspergillus saccharolyticus JOP 1030-1]PYH40191.1 kinase-like protein [Aspergillus saccharolyticus JOP 1030-1]